MRIKQSNVTRTKCSITMYKVSKNDFFGNCWPLMEHGPHWVSFIIFTFVIENNGSFKCLYKIGREFISFDMKERNILIHVLDFGKS